MLVQFFNPHIDSFDLNSNFINPYQPKTIENALNKCLAKVKQANLEGVGLVIEGQGKAQLPGFIAGSVGSPAEAYSLFQFKTITRCEVLKTINVTPIGLEIGAAAGFSQAFAAEVMRAEVLGR